LPLPVLFKAPLAGVIVAEPTCRGGGPCLGEACLASRTTTSLAGRAPVTALKGWLAAGGITSGPIFRSVRRGGAVGGRLPAQSVAEIVKCYAERVGLDPAQFAGHSMRSGFLPSAAKRGESIFKLMDQSRHRSVETLRGYVRDAEIFKEHAGAGLL
jgi:hypothetical protein